MSAKAKTKSRDRRKKQKALRKAANRAHYASLRDSNQNSKRAQKAAKAGRKVKAGKHLAGPCGNIGCAKCSPLARELKLKKHLEREGFNTRLV